MARDTIKEEADFRYELRDALRHLLGTLTPSTERFAAVETTIRHALQTLDNYSEETKLVIAGAAGSGKSTVVNAMIGMPVVPPCNTRGLPVVPFLSETPMLRLANGKAVACGEDGCREHLVSEETLWLDALADRRLHAPLPVIRGPHCYHVKWIAEDSGRGSSCVKPKLSSVATRVATPTHLAGALMLFCVDCRVLGTPKEATVLDSIIGTTDMADVSLSCLRRLFKRVVFLLTHSDYVSEFEDEIVGALRKETEGLTPLRAISSTQAYFKELLQRRFPGVDVTADQIVPFSGRNALLTKRMLLFEPDVQSLYDYCEIMFGAEFMRTVDNMPLEELKQYVTRFAEKKMFSKCGARRVTEEIRLFDFNAGKHLLRDVVDVAMDSVEQLDRALEVAKPSVRREVTDCRTELDAVVRMTAWVTERCEAISATSKKIPEDVFEVAATELKTFFQNRLHELRYVIEGRPLVWFSERHACTVMDMKSSLSRLKSFTETYTVQRTFLEKKMFEGRDSAGSFHFLDDNPKAILQAMESEKTALLVDFCTKVSHHVKDEFSRFLPELQASVLAKLREVVLRYLKTAEAPIHETENRIREPLDLDPIRTALLDCQLIEENERRTKNFLRELPEHVAIAATEISNQWYVPLNEEDLEKGMQIRSKRERYEKELKSATMRQGDDVDDESQFKMPTELLYVLEAWRLSFQMIRLHQLCTFNTHTLTLTVTSSNERILDYVNRLVESLEEGAVAQRDLVVECEEVVREIDVVREQLEVSRQQLDGIATRISDSMVQSIEEAEAIIAEEAS